MWDPHQKPHQQIKPQTANVRKWVIEHGSDERLKPNVMLPPITQTNELQSVIARSTCGVSARYPMMIAARRVSDDRRSACGLALCVQKEVAEEKHPPSYLWVTGCVSVMRAHLCCAGMPEVRQCW